MADKVIKTLFHEPKKDCYYLDEDQKEQYNGYIFIRESESHVGSQFEYSLDELFCSTINVVTIDIQYSEDKTLIDDKESSLMEVDVNVPVRISHEETLYIIEKMRDYTKEENMQVDNLRQLTDKIAHNKGSKRKLFETITKDLNKEFGVSHEAEKIQRKWNGLCDSYKKCKDINRQTGRGPQKFHYYTQMDSFMSERHDVVPVCTATANGIERHRPAEMEEDSKDPPERKKKSKGDALLEYLHERDEKDDKHREKMFEHLKSQSDTMNGFLSGLLEAIKK